MCVGSYSQAPEILEYFRGLARKYDLYKYVKLSHRVVGAQWVEEEGIWRIQVENLATKQVFDDYGHFMITASGVLKYALPIFYEGFGIGCLQCVPLQQLAMA